MMILSQSYHIILYHVSYHTVSDDAWRFFFGEYHDNQEESQDLKSLYS